MVKTQLIKQQEKHWIAVDHKANLWGMALYQKKLWHWGLAKCNICRGMSWNYLIQDCTQNLPSKLPNFLGIKFPGNKIPKFHRLWHGWHTNTSLLLPRMIYSRSTILLNADTVLQTPYLSCAWDSVRYNVSKNTNTLSLSWYRCNKWECHYQW